MAAKVLIVDDDPLMHLLYRRQLEGAGYALLTARDGSEAIEIARSELPSIIVMDIVMEKMHGLIALRELKKFDETKEIPVIIITGNLGAHQTIKREAELGGATGFLSKPFSPGQLLDEIKRLLSSATAS